MPSQFSTEVLSQRGMLSPIRELTQSALHGTAHWAFSVIVLKSRAWASADLGQRAACWERSYRGSDVIGAF
jgi:hypothetical protein